MHHISDEVGASARAPTNEHTLDIVLYSSLTDTVPQPRTVRWHELANDLAEHEERTTKDGPGWSATVYRLASTRGKGGVEDITAVVLDIDHEEPLWSLLDGLEYVAHTTWKHHASDEHADCRGRSDCPHWRIVLPLERPVGLADWEEFRNRVRVWLCPNADEGAKDAPRFFWLPTCRPSTPRDSRRQRGRWLDPGELKPAPNEHPQTEVVFPPATNGADEERPGDRFEREADWLRDILPAWKDVGTRGDNQLIRRPGSTNAWGATISKQGKGVLYVFTDEAKPLKSDTCYSKFGAYAELEHGGDFKVAAKALAERYGPKLVRRKPKGENVGRIGLGGKAHEPAAPSTNGTAHHEDTVSTPGKRPTTDLGNAERFVDRCGGQVRYCPAFSAYIVWDGRRWEVDQVGRAMTLAKKAARSTYAEAETGETKEQRADLASWAKRSEAAARLEAMLRLAQSSVPIATEELDRNPWLLNVANGTVDLRTGALGPHRREDYITKLIDVPYAPDATCPRWEQFLAEVLPDEGSRRFIQRAAGYSATGSARERKLILPYGAGRNGKGVFLQTMRTLLGEYAVRAPSETFLARKQEGIPNDIAQLRGARFVFASETGEGRRLAEAKIKDLTGGEDIAARFMRGEWFSFAPTFTAWLATNHKPTIRGTDPAIWDRIALVPFTVRFRLPDEPEDARPVADPTLAETLEPEREGILAWVVRGAVEWYREGLGTPDAVRRATTAYRDEMDTLGDFLAQRCVIDPQATVGSTKLYDAFKTWLEEQGEPKKSQKWLTGQLEERGFGRRRQHGGTVALCGLRLLGPDETPTDGGGEGLCVVKDSEGFSGIAGSVQKAHVEMPKKGSQPFTTHNPSPGDTDDQRHCWSCKEELLDKTDDRCDDCSSLTCRCGACGCTSEVTA